MLWFRKNWSIDTHAETASFISDDVIRNWLLWFGNGVWQKTSVMKVRQNRNLCERKLICILQRNNLLIPRCPRKTISGNNIGSKGHWREPDSILGTKLYERNNYVAAEIINTVLKKLIFFRNSKLASLYKCDVKISQALYIHNSLLVLAFNRGQTSEKARTSRLKQMQCENQSPKANILEQCLKWPNKNKLIHHSSCHRSVNDMSLKR